MIKEKDKKNKKTKPSESKESSLLKDVDAAGMIAHQYGFTTISSPKITNDDKTKSKQIKDLNSYPGETEDRTAIIRTFQDIGFAGVPQPPMLYFKKPLPGSDYKKKTSIDACGLEIINVSRAVSEALIIKTAWTMLTEYGCSDMYVEINSTGDKESFARFERELHTYFRKNIHELSGELRQKFKENNLNILKSNEKECGDFYHNSPKPLGSLSEQSRIHFKEVLEFLESAGVPYQINNALIGNTNYSSHTIFEIIGKISKSAPLTTLAYGGRYNYLAKKIGYKKDIHCCGATVLCPKKPSSNKKIEYKIKPSKFYLVQLGNLAKLQTLNIIETLRSQNIMVHHSLTKENIGGQLASAEYLKVSHLLIVGQKEAIEKSVVVRSTDIREQETVKMTELCSYLKKIMKGK